MRFAQMHCPECGERALGTEEIVPGVALFDYHDDDSVDYCGETTLCWNAQRTQRDGDGNPMLACANGHGWPSPMEK